MLNKWTFQGVSQALNWVRDRCFTWVARQTIAIDLGTTHLKVVVVAEAFGQTRLVRCHLADLPAEGLLTLEEIDRHLQEIVQSLGNQPLALALPQHASISQLLDLPAAAEAEVPAMIERETRSLGGLSESPIVYDYDRLVPFGRHTHPFWVTIAREQEVQSYVQRLAGPDNDRTFREITSAANALISAYLAGAPRTGRVLLADLGATSTTVAMLFRGQGVFASSLPQGSESFTNAIASLKRCPFDEAEQLKRARNLFTGPDQLPGFQAVVELWRQDLEKLLRDWEEDHPEWRNPREPWTIVLSGGGAAQPGLLAFVQRRSGLTYEAWPDDAIPGWRLPFGRHAVACGLALQACARAPRAVSLLPSSLRQLRRRHEQLFQVNLAGVVAVLVLMFLLAVGFAFKVSVANRKQNELDQARLSLAAANDIARLVRDREQAFDQVRFLVGAQTRTLDVLATWRLLQQIREKRDLWFLLLADRESYATGTTLRTNDTNTVAAPDPLRVDPTAQGTNAGYVVELFLNDRTENRIKTLREVAEQLRNEKIFRTVDRQPRSRQSTNHFDPKQLPPERCDALELELAPKEWQRVGFASPPPAATNATNATRK